MRRFLSVLLFAASAGTAYAQHIELKGVRVGMTVSELNQLYPSLGCAAAADGEAKCDYSRRNPHQENVTELNTLADELVNVWGFGFIDGRLASIYISFPSASYEAVSSALQAKFDKPTTVSDRAMQNAMGATFTSTDLTWRKGADAMVVRQIAGDLKTSSLFLTSSESVKRSRSLRDQKSKARAKDL